MKNKFFAFIENNWKFITFIAIALLIGILSSKILGGIIFGFTSLGAFIKKNTSEKKEVIAVTKHDSVIAEKDREIERLQLEIHDIRNELLVKQGEYSKAITNIKEEVKKYNITEDTIDSFLKGVGG